MTYFSVIIPLYNKEKHIKDTLKSALAQTFTDFEVVIVNDGSTDGSVEKVNFFKDERIKLHSIKNHGVSFARNYGIEKALSENIVFLDADDYWYPTHLDNLKQLIEQFPECGLYTTGYESVFYYKNIFEAKFLDLDKDFFGVIDDYFHHSLINQIAWTSAVAIPKKILDTHGNFDTTMKSGQDADLWTRIALNEKVAFDARISAQKIMTSSQNHLSKTAHVSDRVTFLNKFTEQEKTNPSFKKYMDYNRFSIAIERKMSGHSETFKRIKKDIDLRNLNTKQVLLLKSPKGVLNTLKKLQNFLLKHRIYLSAFR
jgi:glycosyltransferase involved in cell wall biosynthesis